MLTSAFYSILFPEAVGGVYVRLSFDLREKGGHDTGVLNRE
jgi:hypothetical protein